MTNVIAFKKPKLGTNPPRHQPSAESFRNGDFGRADSLGMIASELHACRLEVQRLLLTLENPDLDAEKWRRQLGDLSMRMVLLDASSQRAHKLELESERGEW